MTNINLGTLATAQGFNIIGGKSAQLLYTKAAGDINNDGFKDLLVQANTLNNGVFVILGHTGNFNNIDITTLLPSVGVLIQTTPVQSSITMQGVSFICGNGDVNGDGIADIMISYNTLSTNNPALISVIYGQSNGFSNNIIFDGTDNTKGFQIYNYAWNRAIFADINNDLISDILMYGAQVNVIYGHKGDINNIDFTPASAIQISNSTNTNPCLLIPNNIGDVNGDGITDIGITGYEPSGYYAYSDHNDCAIIYGTKNNWVNTDLSTLTPSVGITITFGNYYGSYAYQYQDQPMCGVDLNGDGIKDIVYGIPSATDPALSNTNGGIVFVIFGSSTLHNLNLGSAGALTPSIGFRIVAPQYSYCGENVSDVGDVNNDGISDLGFVCLGGNGGTSDTYIIYGHKGPFNDIDLTTLSPSAGYSISNSETTTACNFISNVGDINNDGAKDLAVTCPSNSPSGRQNDGEIFVLYGNNSNSGVSTGGGDGGGTGSWHPSYGVHSYDISLLSATLIGMATYQLVHEI